MLSTEFWRGRRVLVTGHTGFKGSWLCILLRMLGARVFGVSINIPSHPSLFELARISDIVESRFDDIRNLDRMRKFVSATLPDVVIHAAAQSLVGEGYRNPIETFETNVIGTANILEAVRGVSSVRVVLIVTTDKCYENRRTQQRFKEEDRLGGSDPYSASKAGAEIVAHAMRESFFPISSYQSHGVGIATVRAGNVIGGGDWARERLVPDIMRALVAGHPPLIRNPDMTRPWQHVIDPLNGYLHLAERLWADGQSFSGAWNFGPDAGSEWPVRRVADRICQLWQGNISWIQTKDTIAGKESPFLALDSTKARTGLSWSSTLNIEDALLATVSWYRNFCDGQDVREISRLQLSEYLRLIAAS